MQIFSAKQFRLTEDQFERLYSIIIAAYANTEKEVWGENYVRISPEDFQKLIDADEIYFAFLEGRIVGGVRCFQLSETVWSFSLLGADFAEKGKGIGRALIEKCEEIAKAHGGKQIHIEILRANDMEVESKNILSNWYQRLGYDLVKTVDVFEVYDDAEKWSKLANPSAFDCYLKVF